MCHKKTPWKNVRWSYMFFQCKSTVRPTLSKQESVVLPSLLYQKWRIVNVAYWLYLHGRGIGQIGGYLSYLGRDGSVGIEGMARWKDDRPPNCPVHILFRLIITCGVWCLKCTNVTYQADQHFYSNILQAIWVEWIASRFNNSNILSFLRATAHKC